MVKIKFDGMEISCNHEAAEYLVCLCESVLFVISISGSDAQYRKCDAFINTICTAIDADLIAISYDEYKNLRIAVNIYRNYLLFKGVPAEDAEVITDLLRNGKYRKRTKEIIFSTDDFAQIISQLKFAYESDSFECHYNKSSRIIADFYEKYKAVL